MHWPLRRPFFTIVLYKAILLTMTWGESYDSGSGSGNDTSCEDCNTDNPPFPTFPFPFFPRLPPCESGPCQHRPDNVSNPKLNRILDASLLSLLPCSDDLTKLTSLKYCDTFTTIASEEARFSINSDPALPLFYKFCFIFTHLPKVTVCTYIMCYYFHIHVSTCRTSQSQ